MHSFLFVRRLSLLQFSGFFIFCWLRYWWHNISEFIHHQRHWHFESMNCISIDPIHIHAQCTCMPCHTRDKARSLRAFPADYTINTHTAYSALWIYHIWKQSNGHLTPWTQRATCISKNNNKHNIAESWHEIYIYICSSAQCHSHGSTDKCNQNAAVLRYMCEFCRTLLLLAILLYNDNQI